MEMLKMEMKKLLNKREKSGRSYLVEKYGLKHGLLAMSYLYIETHKNNTLEKIKSLSHWINAKSEDREEVYKIIEQELNS